MNKNTKVRTALEPRSRFSARTEASKEHGKISSHEEREVFILCQK